MRGSSTGKVQGGGGEGRDLKYLTYLIPGPN